MRYGTPGALRDALEHRLRIRSETTGIGLDRLRRRVVFERVVARLQAAEPDRWVLKGGMALEVRLRDQARLTKDIDLGLRDQAGDGPELHARLVEALTPDPFGDDFVILAKTPRRLIGDGPDSLVWRASVDANLAGRLFGRLSLDIAPRGSELDATQRVQLPNSLAFAGIESPTIEIIDVQRHAAEKFHGMQRDFGIRDNSRVRDLVDLVILHENDLIDPPRLSAAVRNVWREREQTEPPATLPAFPESWPDRYEQLATDHDLQTRAFPAAVTLVTDLWVALFTTEEH